MNLNKKQHFIKRIKFRIHKIMNGKKLQRLFIEERMRFFAQDIDSYSIGDIVIDNDGAECEVTNKTLNSIEIYITKKKDDGVNCKQWFAMNSFNMRFNRK